MTNIYFSRERRYTSEVNFSILHILRVGTVAFLFIFVAQQPKSPVPVAARSEVYVCDRSPAGIVGSNPAGAWISVCCECCVLSGRGLCDRLISRPEETYRLWCVVVCGLET
jgi:hypothetical protein